MGITLAAICAILYGTCNVLLKKGMEQPGGGNGTLATLGFNVFSLGLLSILSPLFSPNPHQLDWTGMGYFALAGFFTSVLGRYALFVGIGRIGPSRSIAIKNASPLFTLVFAIIALNETVTLWAWVGFALLLFGLYLLGVQFFRHEQQQAASGGYMLALLSAVGYGVGNGIQKLGIQHMDQPIIGAFIGCLAGFAFLSVLELRKKQFMNALNGIRNPYILAVGILTSISQICFFLALRYTSVAYAGAIIAIEPILTILFSRIFLKQGEQLTLLVSLSALFVFAGAVLIAFLS